MNTRYQVIGPIAEGGRGEVVKAWDGNLGREVAIKRVKKEEGETDDSAIEDLVKEARTLSTLQHPNVVSVYDVGLDEEGAYIVMELVKGDTLEDIVAKGAMTERDFDSLVNQTMEGLIAAHAAGLIHLDLKPQNLMITWHASGSFQVKILDFGLALAAVQPVHQEVDENDSLLGSIYFMAPEQFERSPVDPRTDLYSLGCILYYALTGKYPFRGETAPEVMTAHMYHKLTPLAKLRPDLNPFFHQWVESLMSRLPDERPKSTAKALAAFRQRTMPSAPVPVVAVAEEPAPVAAPAPDVAVQKSVKMEGGKVKRELQPEGLLGGSKKVAVDKVAGASGPTAIRTQGRSAKEEKHSKLVTILNRYSLPILAVLVLISAAVFFMRRSASNARMERFVELSADETLPASAEDVRLLLRFIDDPDSSAAAAQTLTTLQGAGAIDAMILQGLQNAKGRNPQVNLLNVCTLRGIEASVPEALKLMGSSDPNVKKAAWNNVAALGTDSLIPDLLLKIETLDDSYRKSAELAVVSIVERSENVDRAAAPVVNAYRTGLGSDEYKAMLVRMLGKMGSKDARTQLDKAIKSRSLEVRKAALSSIAQWPTHEPLPMLVGQVESESDPAARLLTIMAGAQLLTRPGEMSQEELFGYGAKLYAQAKDRREQDQALTGLSRVLSPETVAFFEKLGQDDPKRTNQAESIAGTLREKLDRTVVVEGEATELPAASAEFNPNSMMDLDKGALINWEDNADWAAWVLDFAEAGTYKVLISQASEADPTAVYEVVLGTTSIQTQTVPTEGKFKDFEIGEIPISSPGTHRLLVRAVRIPGEGSAMSVKGLQLTR